MAKIFHITEDIEEKDLDKGYGHRHHGEYMLEKAFKEGCEHGYNKAMRELEGFHEKSGKLRRGGFREEFEDRIEKLKEKYK